MGLIARLLLPDIRLQVHRLQAWPMWKLIRSVRLCKYAVYKSFTCNTSMTFQTIKAKTKQSAKLFCECEKRVRNIKNLLFHEVNCLLLYSEKSRFLYSNKKKPQKLPSSILICIDMKVGRFCTRFP